MVPVVLDLQEMILQQQTKVLVVQVYNYHLHITIQKQHMDSLDLMVKDSGSLVVAVVDHIH